LLLTSGTSRPALLMSGIRPLATINLRTSARITADEIDEVRD
jgi:hypothetical protein